MRKQEATARRYAKALFLAAREAGRQEAIGQELESALRVVATNRRLEEVLTRPWITGATKKAIATAIAERLGCSALVKNFLGLLAGRGRIDHVAEIARAYRDLLDQAAGRVRAQVKSAVALGERERQQLGTGLGRIVGKAVIVEDSVDATLLGGFVAQIGSLVLDGSLDGQLARVRERVVRG